MLITSLDNERVKKYIKLKEKKYRDQTGEFIVEGSHLVLEAYRAGLIKELILEKDLTSDALYDKIMSMVSDKDRLKEMSENLKPLAKVDALEKIYELMIKMAKGDRK